MKALILPFPKITDLHSDCDHGGEMRNFFRTLAPEQFDANVSIRTNGSYSYSYHGTLIFVPALIQASRAGFLDPHLDARLSSGGNLRLPRLPPACGWGAAHLPLDQSLSRADV